MGGRLYSLSLVTGEEVDSGGSVFRRGAMLALLRFRQRLDRHDQGVKACLPAISELAVRADGWASSSYRCRLGGTVLAGAPR